MLKPLSLTSEQQSIIITASAALSPGDRQLLRERVLEQLATLPEIGDGAVYRCCRAAQRSLWTPPTTDELKHRHGPHLFRKIG